MAKKDIINPVDVNNPSTTRRTADMLPGYIRTDKNTKFLASTLDQFIQEPQLERVDGFVGSKLSLNYIPSLDSYIDGGSKLRNDYQLEPSLIVKDIRGAVKSALGYDDLINQLEFKNSPVDNLDRLFRPKSFSYDPLIDWDKFINFRQYYWLPTGPDSIEITGQQLNTVSTYTVKDSADGTSLVFTPPDGATTDPLITLYRGMTYVFNVNSKYSFYIKTAYVTGVQDLYSGASNNGTKNGQVVVTIDDFTPVVLFYYAEGNNTAVGRFLVKSLAENTEIDVENEIIGKQTFKSGNGVEFSNGMKVHFVGNVMPDSYLGNEYIVEGVGSAIKLVDFASLQTTGNSTTNLNVNFDATPFDKYPFDDFQFVPLTPAYITSNRSSPDRNTWARYNRWVHESVIAATAAANSTIPVYEVDYRAQRPIIEFAAGLQLYNFGVRAKDNVDVIDTTTENAFRTVEGSRGFYVDGALLEQGYRVIFNADTDSQVRGRVYEVKFVTINDKQVINLEEVLDSEPSLDEALVVVRGNKYAGTNWWFDGSAWVYGQQKTSLNQAPLFEIFDDNDQKLSDQIIFNNSFRGTRLFGYAEGSGTVDPVLGFSLKYQNVANVGDYLFNNYFMTDTFNDYANGSYTTLGVAGNYLKINTDTESVYRDVWVEKVDQPMSILQFQSLEADATYIQINAIDNPGYTKDLTVELFVNDVKQHLNVNYTFNQSGINAFVVSKTKFALGDRVLIKLYTSKTPNANGYYEVPINLTNNPLNGPVSDFTFTELSNHVKTITDSNVDFSGVFPGVGNLRDLSDVSAYGSQIVSHSNPISFAHYFLGTKENNIVDSVRKVAFDYSQFKTALINQITALKGNYTPAESLDVALSNLNSTKDTTVSYAYSDMLAYGKNHSTRTYTVKNARNKQYSLVSAFNDTVLSERAVFVYLNGQQLIKGYDYTFSQYEPNITITRTLVKGDIITILDYPTTTSNFVPPTPTKLGLYPKFKPEIYYDNTYVGGPQRVIQGHDGSITLAFNDYRDDVILEFETRIYNNIKVSYNPQLLNIDTMLSGAFRTQGYSLAEVTDILEPDFLKWTGFYGVDYQTNSTFDELNPFTFNYSSNIDSLGKKKLPGYWRAVYDYFYDTDRPHTHPWEMLGFTEQPDWWEDMYGAAPYTSGNKILWDDLEAGRIAQGPRTGIDLTYARPGLSTIIPVDEYGNLLNPTDTGLATNPIINNDPHRIVVLRADQIAAKWKFGDQAPAETAWRRSSYWPFVAQILTALTSPATYSALMFDPSRVLKNRSGQYKYGIAENFLSLSKVDLYRDVVDSVRTLAIGYSVYVIEIGLTRDINYLNNLKTDLSNTNYNLMSKLGGFASKDKLQVTIDAVDPTSPYPGVLVPAEDYNIFFNKSTPILSIGISGMIIQKTGLGWAIRGYDKYQPYFTILKPMASNAAQVDRVGGISKPFVNWAQNTVYNVDQVVYNGERYYQVISKHNSGLVFDKVYYQSLPYLPTEGGIAVYRRSNFEQYETRVPYGVEYTTAQDVYDLIVGYGAWLESQGFVFDEYNNDLQQVLDWTFTAREFLYWVTQNWSVNSVITLSPFANTLKFTSKVGVVDNIFNNFYEYSLLKADGASFPQRSFSIVRLDGECKISTVNTQEGLFFAKLNIVQKEHVIVFNNTTLFNDIVYDIDSGYRQRRVNLKGFRTANWNGDFFSPGFVFDNADVRDWEKFVDYSIGEVVRFSGKYYTAPKSIVGTDSFNFNQWILLGDKPAPNLLPNFDYKINQFEDFYSLDIDNFDAGQQAMAQHLIGYTPRPYLNYIIGDPIAQYKFYQGYIKEKGTRNPLTKLAKASLNTFRSSIDFNEEWAFRIGYYGGYNTFQELEIQLESTAFIENPQILEFIQTKPIGENTTVYYKDLNDLIITPEDFDINQAFPTVDTTYEDNNFQLPVAGYVRFDDVTATAYNKNSVLDIANNKALFEGNTIWLGFKENGEWDVLRVTQIPTRITGVGITSPGQAMTFATYYPHQLAAGDLISVSRMADGIDQCYIVSEIVSPNEFIVLTTMVTLPPLTFPTSGLLFAFKSSRLDTLEQLFNIPFLERWNYGEKVWVDDAGDGKWAVYQKINNYDSVLYNNTIIDTAQNFSSRTVTASGSNIVAVSSPDFVDSNSYYGLISVLFRNDTGSLRLLFDYALNDNNIYYTGTGETNFGSSLAFDARYNLIVAGAPLTSNVIPNTNHNQGAVKLSILDIENYQETAQEVITTPHATTSSLFGISLALATEGTKLAVGSPGDASAIGAIYVYDITVNTLTNAISISSPTTLNGHSTAERFGYSVTGNRSLSKIAVAAPANINNGAVYIYVDNSLSQTIYGSTIKDVYGAPDNFALGEFASLVKISADGNYLFIGSPYAFDPSRGTSSGVVDVFIWNGSEFKYKQRLHAPINTNDVSFGYDISIDNDTLVVSSVGNSSVVTTTFDTYLDRLSTSTGYTNDPDSDQRKKTTTFDSGATGMKHKIPQTGAVHTYNLINTTWIYGQELVNNNIPEYSLYGQSVFAVDGSIFVGAPSTNSSGQLYIFDKKDATINTWSAYRNQEASVDLSLINRANTVDVITEQVQDYIDIIDPIKGRILGTAEQELKYMTSYDPAIYSLGITGVNVNSESNWLDEHVGELWWDLSTVKYIWYEQGELEYRKNNWNNIFPGSTIDVYEWVRSEYLPAEWNQLADTSDGLTRSISGKPKFADNSVVSVKQVYNSVSNTFKNVYYFWVKNKTIVPSNVPNRRQSAFSIAQDIADPKSSDVEFMAVISPTALILTNTKPKIGSDTINLNIAFDYINDAANRHTEWLLLQENDKNSRPNWLLEKKLIDSLLGHDSLSNPVPDPRLPSKIRYGVGIRPRQGLFVDRFEALRNLIEFSNTALAGELITGRVSFENLNAMDEIPPADTYDIILEDIYNLELVPTKLLITAKVTATVNSDGKIDTVTIVDPGYGYLVAPTIEIVGNGTNAELSTTLDLQGRVSTVSIVDAGQGYTSEPTLLVRPFTAVVQTDNTINGKWSVYAWNDSNSTWARTRTQNFDTTQYWKYVDWADVSYDPLKTLTSTVASVYALDVLKQISVNSYVKVSNGGDGRYVIVRRTNGLGGTFDKDWDLVYSQNGTIEFSSAIWNLNNTVYAWDKTVGFDQTTYDQTPDKEIEYILTAIKDDLFIGTRKLYWNQFFFKAVRYAMSEQKFLDWAFKTTFISVINNSGSLDQIHTYKLEDVNYYEDFLKEIKPYHTKIRKFTQLYTGTDLSQTFTTDFDLPSYYNTATLNFNKVEFGSDLLLSYPWKSWYDNYTYGVASIDIFDGGSGYTQTPTVNIIPAPGDTGRDATAVAFISLGKVNRVIVTNPGQGYAATPTVSFNGGGSTALTSAKAYVQLGKNNIRSNNLTLKFDRVSGRREIGNQYFTDTFSGNGSQVTFKLTWVPIADKELITLTKNGVLQLVDAYTIEFTTETYHPQDNTSYGKKYATLKLNFIPDYGDQIEITYPKTQLLYTAVDRIEDYYAPTAGMPGSSSTQLMSGLEFPGLVVDTLPFSYAAGWSSSDKFAWDSTTWDNYSSEVGYTAFSTSATTAQTFTLTNIVIGVGTQVNVYVNKIRIDGVGGLVPTLIGSGEAAVDHVEILSSGAGYQNSYVDVTISAPNTLIGQQAKVVLPTIANGGLDSNGGIVKLPLAINYSGKGYTEAPLVTITERVSSAHTSTVKVKSYAKAILKAGFTTTNTTTQYSIIIPAAAFTTATNLVEFRYSDSDGTVLPTDYDSLDSVISAGDLTYTTALGTSPSEMLLDGDAFLTPYNSHAPEEKVPGQVQEAVGINVYTRPTETPLLMVTKKYWVDGVTVSYALGIKPTTDDSIIAIFNDRKLLQSEYIIDYDANTLTFTSNSPGYGWISITSIQAGTISLLDYLTVTTSTTSTTLASLVGYSEVGSVYVTANGVPTTNYILSSSTNLASLTVNESGTIQAYFLRGTQKSVSEVIEQIIIATTSTAVFDLMQPPGNVEPYHSQVIITKNGARLNPPVTTYYQVSNNQLIFDISQSIVYPKRRIGLRKLEVYVNGVRVPTGANWELNLSTNQVIFSSGSLSDGDVIAIVVKNGNDYLIQNNQLVLSTAVDINDELHITTFTNHDPDFIRTERFNGHVDNQYEMQRAVLDSSYVWISYNGDPLIANQDYTVAPNGTTITIRSGFYSSPADSVVITSFAKFENRLVAFRIFKDMLGRTVYKRLSQENSTALSEPLSITATTITVVDASALTTGNTATNTPGVILINGERIEFFTVTGNVLGQLRRGTLGTMPKDLYVAGTTVIDQGTSQTVPFVDTTTVYKFTATSTSSYVLKDVKLIDNANYWDQLEVKLAGRGLLKSGAYTLKHNYDLNYDSTGTADTVILPEWLITTSTVVAFTTNYIVSATSLVTTTATVTSTNIVTSSTIKTVGYILTSTEIVYTYNTITNSTTVVTSVIETNTATIYTKVPVITTSTVNVENTVYTTTYTTIYNTSTYVKTKIENIGESIGHVNGYAVFIGDNPRDYGSDDHPGNSAIYTALSSNVTATQISNVTTLQIRTLDDFNIAKTSTDIVSISALYPWYPVTLSYAWCTFMNSYAIWNDQDGGRLTRSVYFPTSGNYTFKYSVDNYGTFEFESTVVIQRTGDNNYSAVYSAVVAVTAGTHNITVAGYNISGPAGVAAQILNPDGTELWNARTPQTLIPKVLPTHVKMTRADGVQALYQILTASTLLFSGMSVSRNENILLGVQLVWSNDPGTSPYPEQKSTIEHNEVYVGTTSAPTEYKFNNTVDFNIGYALEENETISVVTSSTVADTVSVLVTSTSFVSTVTYINVPEVITTTATVYSTSTVYTTSTIITTSTIYHTSTYFTTEVSYNTSTVISYSIAYNTATVITTSTNTIINYVTVATVPMLQLKTDVYPGLIVEVIQRSSQTWYDTAYNTQSLGANHTVPVKFLLERTAALPDKYRYE